MNSTGPIRFDGPVSGIDYQSIIDKLVSVEQRPATLLQNEIKLDTTKETAFQDLTAKLLALKGAAGLLGSVIFFDRTKVSSSNTSVLTASGDNVQSIGSFNFSVRQLAQAQQVVSSGLASETAALGAGTISLEFGNGFVNRRTPLDFLNGQAGIDHGMVRLTAGGIGVNVDLTDAVTAQDVVDRINNNGVLNVTAAVSGDGLSIQNGTGSALTVADTGGHTTATSLGIAGSVGAGLTLFGSRINTVTNQTALRFLNDGLGVRSVSGTSFSVTARSGASFNVTVNSTDTTVQNILDDINNATGNSGKVTARLNPEGNALELIDNTAGAGALKVTALGGSNAAYDLGLVGVQSELNGVAGAAGSNFLLGKRLIPTLDSVLTRTLNGGSGEFQDQFSTGKLDGVADGVLRIDGRNGVTADVNLGARIATTLTSAPVFNGATNTTSFNVNSTAGMAVGNQVRLVNGTNQMETVAVTGISGSTVTVAGALQNAYAIGNSALASNQTLADMMNAIAGAPGENLTVGFNSAGNGLVITDTTANATNALRITDVRKGLTGTGAGTPTTLVDSALIGLPNNYYNGAIVRVTSGTNAGYAGVVTGFNGTTGTLTLANAAGAAFDATSGFEIETQPNDFTTRIPSTQATGGTTTTIVAPSLQGYPSGYFVNQRVVVTSGTNAGYQGTVTAFNSTTGTLTLSTAAGVAFDATSVFRLDDTDRKAPSEALGIRTATTGQGTATGTATTLIDGSLVGLPNNFLVGSRVQVTSGTDSGFVGLVTGFNGTTGTLTFANAAGAAFDNTSKFTIDAALGNKESGGELHPQYIGENTALSTLNQGKGVFAGQFLVQDRNGKSFTVDLSGVNNTTIGAVIQNINGGAQAIGSDLRAGIDPTGNGIELVSPTGAGQILVRDLNGGTTASDLNIAGTAPTATPSTLDGSFEFQFTVGATDSLDTLVQNINSRGLNVAASVLNTGSSVNPFELSLLSRTSGSAGRMVFTSSVPGLSLSTSTAAQDSVVLYGGSGGSGNPTLLVNSTNTVTNVVPGLTVNLLSTSTSPVTVTVGRDAQGIQDQVKTFVDAYNKVVDSIGTYTKFDPNDPTNTGILFADSTVGSVQQVISDGVTLPVDGIPVNQLNTLSKVGIRVDGTGHLQFDSSKLSAALSTNFDGVKTLFTKFRTLAPSVLLSDLNDGLGVHSVTGGNDFQIIQRNGNTISVGVSGLKTVGDVLNAINFSPQNTGLQVSAGTTSDGKSFQLVDSSSGRNGSAATAGAGTFTDASLSGFASNFWNNQQVTFTSGPLAGQTFSVTGFNQATQTITFNSTQNPGVGSGYTLIHDFQVNALSNSTAAADLGISTDVGNNSTITGRQIFLTKDPGIGRRVSDDIGGLTDLPDGAITRKTSTLQDDTKDLQKRIDEINKRADDLRQSLILKFAALENFLAQSQQVQAQLSAALPSTNSLLGLQTKTASSTGA